MGQAYNWVVCEQIGKENVYLSGNGQGNLVEVKVNVLKKIGILKMDSYSDHEFLVWGIDRENSILATINCLFV